MKTLLLSTLVMLLGVGAFAQGTITFANASSTPGLTPADRQVRFSAGAPFYDARLVPGANVSSNYAGVDLSRLRVGLLYAPETVTDLSQFSEATILNDYPTFRSSTSALAGTWFSKQALLPGVSPGQTVNMCAVVWDIWTAPNPLDIQARNSGLWGQSAIFKFTVPSGSSPPPEDYVLQNLRAFEIIYAPEPDSGVFLGLAATSLLLRRLSRPKVAQVS